SISTICFSRPTTRCGCGIRCSLRSRRQSFPSLQVCSQLTPSSGCAIAARDGSAERFFLPIWFRHQFYLSPFRRSSFNTVYSIVHLLSFLPIRQFSFHFRHGCLWVISKPSRLNSKSVH